MKIAPTLSDVALHETKHKPAKAAVAKASRHTETRDGILAEDADHRFDKQCVDVKLGADSNFFPEKFIDSNSITANSFKFNQASSSLSRARVITLIWGCGETWGAYCGSQWPVQSSASA
jgi:hypothetical protein